MAGVPFIFGNATTSIPLTNLDADFNTGLTIGNTTVGLGNTVTTLGNVTLTNTTISSPSGIPANAVIYSNTSGNLTGNTSVLTVKGANLGIGISNPTQPLQISGGIATEVDLFVSGTRTGTFYVDNSQMLIDAVTAIPMVFKTSDTEAMRINSSGNLLVGTTVTDPTFNRANGANIGNNGSILSRSAGGWDCGLSTTSGFNISFYTDNGSARVSAGYISSNGSVTAYNATSDYRLKQNIAPLQNSLAKVLQLKPCSYNYIEGNQYSEGFVAHELQAIIPEAVTGEKDAVNEDGSIKAQGVDTSFLVATLTAAIQELNATITTQSEQIAALQAKVGV